MKKTVCVLATVVTCSSLCFASSNFNDIKGHWAEKTISEFTSKGFVNGYSDGTFKPNNNVTRAEFIIMLDNYFGLTNKSGKTFSDLENHWAKEAIDIAITNGVIKDLFVGKFNPSKAITREEVCVLVSNYLNLADTNLDKVNKFIDSNNVSSAYKSAMEGMIERNYIGGYEDNTLRPKGNITRAEAVSILNRVKVDSIPPVSNNSNSSGNNNNSGCDVVPTQPVVNAVYINGGESKSNKYHKSPTAHNMEGAILMDKEEAHKHGYVPCGICYK